MSTHARPLAVWLAAADDAALEHLFDARDVRPDATWNDFFDAAEALLEPASVDRALAALPAADAAALVQAVAGQDAGAARGRLHDLALLDDDGHAPTPVAQAVATRGPVPHVTIASPVAASPQEAGQAAETAFATTARMGDLLLAAHETPLLLLATGALTAGEKKRLADSGIDAQDADDLLAIGEHAGLLRRGDRRVLITAAGEEWSRLGFADRWRALVTSFRAALPAGLRDGDGWIALSAWPGAYPWDSAWPERHGHLHRQARLLGVAGDGDGEPPWAQQLRSGQAPDPAALAGSVPVEVDRVFLQNDLTAIAPGPLHPALEVRLRGMVERDTAQSSSYRFTADSITRALVEGETEETILAFLSELSLTGLPQPLAYLVSQTAARHGLVRVWGGAEGTVVTSSDAHLIETLGIDRNLRPLGLLEEDGMLVTRVKAENVYWALVDARYPATLVDDDGHPVSMRRTPPAAEADEPAVDHTALIARLREKQGPDADAAWLDRELDAAVRHRAVILVEVGMPDGSTRDLTLEATGLGGGRLRGRDRAADVERTLPVSSIRAVRILDQPTEG